jgi:hypothetical protein
VGDFNEFKELSGVTLTYLADGWDPACGQQWKSRVLFSLLVCVGWGAWERNTVCRGGKTLEIRLVHWELVLAFASGGVLK